MKYTIFYVIFTQNILVLYYELPSNYFYNIKIKNSNKILSILKNGDRLNLFFIYKFAKFIKEKTL